MLYLKYVISKICHIFTLIYEAYMGINNFIKVKDIKIV